MIFILLISFYVFFKLFYGIWICFVNNFIGQLKVFYGIPIYASDKILVVVIKIDEITMMVIHHGGDAVEAVTIYMIFFQPESNI